MNTTNLRKIRVVSSKYLAPHLKWLGALPFLLFFRISLLIIFIILLFSGANVFADQVTLAWDPNTDETVAGYKIYYGNTSHNYPWRIDVGNTTSYTISNLQGGRTYYIAATAYDINDNESDYSNEVVYAAPNCKYSISPARKSVDAHGGPGSVNVTVAAECNWTAVSNASWLVITSNNSGSGSGTVNYSVSANPETTTRKGTSSIAGKTFTLTQKGVPKFRLTVRKSGGRYGTVTSNPPGTTFKEGTVVNLTATPNPNAIFSGWSGACTGTFPNCAVTMNQNTTVTATFKLKTSTITATAGAGGTITPNGSVVVNQGTTKKFTIRPNAGYQVSDVKVDGVSQGPITTYTFSNITTDHTIEASFSSAPSPS
jgi:hypothetical protein